MRRSLSSKHGTPIGPDVLWGDVTLSASLLLWNLFHSSSEHAMHMSSRLNMGPLCSGHGDFDSAFTRSVARTPGKGADGLLDSSVVLAERRI